MWGEARKAVRVGGGGAVFPAGAQPVPAIRTQCLELAWAWSHRVEGVSGGLGFENESCIGEALLAETEVWRVKSQQQGSRGEGGGGVDGQEQGAVGRVVLGGPEAVGGWRGGSRVWGLNVEEPFQMTSSVAGAFPWLLAAGGRQEVSLGLTGTDRLQGAAFPERHSPARGGRGVSGSGGGSVFLSVTTF